MGSDLETMQGTRDMTPDGQEPHSLPHSSCTATELEGEWTMISCTHNGKPMDASFVRNARRLFRGGETILFVGGQVFMNSRFTAKGEQIAYVDQRQHGIYQISADTLRTSLAGKGEAPASDFTTMTGDGKTVSEWTRKK